MNRIFAHFRTIADNLPGRIERWAEQSRDYDQWDARAGDGAGEGPWFAALVCLFAGVAFTAAGLLWPGVVGVLLWVGLALIAFAGWLGAAVVLRALRG